MIGWTFTKESNKDTAGTINRYYRSEANGRVKEAGWVVGSRLTETTAAVRIEGLRRLKGLAESLEIFEGGRTARLSDVFHVFQGINRSRNVNTQPMTAWQQYSMTAAQQCSTPTTERDGQEAQPGL